MKTKILLIGLMLASTSLLAHSAQHNATFGEGVEVNTNPQYTLVYFNEAWSHTLLIVTHPSGKRESSIRHFKRKEAHSIGDYAMLMPMLTKLSADGFRVISHSVSTRVVEEGTDSWHHVYVLEKVGEQ